MDALPNQLVLKRPEDSDHIWHVIAGNTIVFQGQGDMEPDTLLSCQLWLHGKGYKNKGTYPPDCFLYFKETGTMNCDH